MRILKIIVRVRLSEINASFLKKLRAAFEQLTDRKDPEIDIVLSEDEYDPALAKELSKS